MDGTTNADANRSLASDGGKPRSDAGESTLEADATDDRSREAAPSERSTRPTKQPLGADEAYCWGCGVPIKSAAEICPKCGVRQRPPPSTGQTKSPGIAALASAVWTGAGQIYNGEIGKGIVLMVLMFVSALSMIVVIGFLTTPLIWGYSIYDAYRTAERTNQQQSRSPHEF
jgi:TM2 domain-containing membrane protein YozV